MTYTDLTQRALAHLGTSYLFVPEWRTWITLTDMSKRHPDIFRKDARHSSDALNSVAAILLYHFNLRDPTRTKIETALRERLTVSASDLVEMSVGLDYPTWWVKAAHDALNAPRVWSGAS